MELHKSISVVFASFAGLMLVWNVFMPNNPHHDLNIIEMSCLLVVFTFTYFSHSQLAKATHILTLGVVAFIPMGIAESPFFGAVIAVFALVLLYAYGGYRTHAFWKIPVTFVVLVVLCSLATSYFSPPGPIVIARAFIWTVFIFVFLGVLYLILEDIKRKFYSEFASELIEQNRQLLEINKELTRGPADANYTGKVGHARGEASSTRGTKKNGNGIVTL